MNREELKQAIADAKTIKETAIANAKLALEEAFTPQLTAMFAEKLNELELEEEVEESVEENYSEDGLEETFNLEELLAELEMEEGTKETDETANMEEGLDEDLMLEEMSDEEIEELVSQVIDDMITSGKLMAGEEYEEEEESEEEMDMDDMDMEDEEEESEEEVDLEELLAEMEEKVKEGYEDAPIDIVLQLADILKITPNEVNMMAAALPAVAIGGMFIAPKVKELFSKLKKSIGSKKVSETPEATEMEETINELRNELNEVNLLNAKLLYTNKIFKAKNLTESDKVKVLNAFDKAENVKAVKLVYETLTENLKSTSIVKKSPVKESLGSASRTITPATPKQPIVEVNEAFARMQKIAGIKK